MPKSIIREFDNSKVGNLISSNFSVFVPGFCSKDGDTEALRKEAQALGIYFKDSGIYLLNSQKQFKKYIGKFGGGLRDAKAPVLEQLRPDSQQLTEIEKYRRNVDLSEIIEESSGACNWYSGKVITNPTALNGKLLKTFSNNETIQFTKVSWLDLKDDCFDDDTPRTSTVNEYYKILPANIGNDAGGYEHMGNQIAWELLGLGYTIYYKPLDKEAPDVITQLSDPLFWEALKSKSTYSIRYLTSGGCADTAVAEQMVAIAEFNNKVDIDTVETYGNESGRGDCIALLDINEDLLGNTSTKEKLLLAFGNAAKILPASKYAAIFAPKVVYTMDDDEDYGNNKTFPCSFHYLACAARAQERYAEWYAVAGYTRGIADKSIAYTTYTFGDIDINTLAPRVPNTYTDRAINLVLSERGNYYLWGNRTSEVIDEGLLFSHFLNIRQLCCTIKQVLYSATRNLTFDPNSDLLWINFVNAIRPTLESMKADQGIAGYKISRVEAEKKALLVAKIRIVPIEALEDFDISIYLEDSLSGIILSADEEEAE